MPRLQRSVPILLLAVAAPAAAEWLVTHSGEEIETAGDWEVRGALVVFKTAGGQLSSLRASTVDLDESRARSAQSPTAGRAR